MKYLIIILFLLSSCESRRAANKTEWLKKHGYLTTDTVSIPGETIKGETLIKLDSAKLDSVANVLAEQYQNLLDSCANSKGVKLDSTLSKMERVQNKAKIKGLINQIPCKINPVDTSNNRYELKIWIDGGNLRYDFKIKDLEVNTNCPKCPEPSWYEKWWFGFICGLLIPILILWLVNRKNYVK